MKPPVQDSAALREFCLPFIRGEQSPATAEQLMASRYVAYTLGEIKYIVATTASEFRPTVDVHGIREWSAGAEWLGLEILKTTRGDIADETGEVEFIARYLFQGQSATHHEHSTFRREEGTWVFVKGQVKPS